MRSSISCVAVVLVAVSFAVTVAQFPGGGAAATVTMAEITNFGTNPSNIKMFLYKPKNLPAGAQKVPMLVAIHYCGATAQQGETWFKMSPLADQYNFYIVYPQATRQNKCWEAATDATLKHGGGGDGQSIASMVEYMIKTYPVDAGRIYVTGFSSGASMTSSIAAIYPNLFEGASAVAGLPPGCNDTAVNRGFQKTCWAGPTTKTPEEWGAAVRKAYPEFKGRYPRVLLWHGQKDEILSYSYFVEEVKVWQNLHNISSAPTLTNAKTNVSDFTWTQYGTTDAHPPFATMTSPTSTHAVPYNPEMMIKFFGIDGSYNPSAAGGGGGDVCAANNGGCSADATCTPPSGGATQPTCKCKTGFTGTGLVCTATPSNACASNNGGCSRDATCTLTGTKVTCECKDGFTGDGQTCTAVPATNACATNFGGCDEVNGACTVRQEVVTCSCKNGFVKQGNTDKCVPRSGVSTGRNPTVNPCASNHGGCSEFAECTVSSSRVTCRCQDGYEGDGKDCTKIDDEESTGGAPTMINFCRTQNGGCSPDAKCRNGATANAVRCSCNDGFEGNGRTCLPLDGAVTGDNTSSSKTPMIIGIVVGAVVVIAIVAYLLYRRSNNSTRFNKDINMVQTTGGSPLQAGCPQNTQPCPYPPQPYYAPPTQQCPPPPMMPRPPQPY